MAPEHKVFLFILACVVSLLLGFGLAREFQAQSPLEDEETGRMEILYFEGHDSLFKLRFADRVDRQQWTLATDNVTQGIFSLRISFPYEGGWFVTSGTFNPDWSSYGMFQADITNPGVERLQFAVIIRDDEAPRELPPALAAGTEMAAAHEALRQLAREPHTFVYYRAEGMESGQSTESFAVPTMAAAGVNPRSVRDLYFYMFPSELPQVVFLDNIRLEGGADEVGGAAGF